MKWLESTLKQFIPASVIFAILFLVLRIYELVLLRSVVGDEVHISRIEIGAIGYDAVFALILISGVLVIHLFISIVSKGTACVISAIIFMLLLVFDYGVIQYFSSTLTPLSTDLFGYSPQEIFTTVLSSGGVRWTSVTPLVVVIPLLIALLIELKRRNFLERIPFKFILSGSSFFLIAWFLPYAPSPESFEGEMDFYLATNKMHYFMTHAIDYSHDRTSVNDTSEEYPLLHPIDYKDNLGQFFSKPSSSPNLVFIIVEGLGRDFTGPGAAYGGFTPFLDSLSGQGLYWENFLSNAGRTFGALPSILGSLPYSREGFMSRGTKMPDHQTLISLLKPYGYSSNFFYGGNPNFDKQDIFLEYQGFDKMIDQTKFPASFKALNHLGEASSWGYPDQEVFRFTIQELQGAASPRVDVYLTLSTHKPFDVPDKNFEKIFDEKLQQVNWPESRRRIALDKRKIFSCLLYTDNAIRSLMRSYASEG